jgi:integrase
MAKRYLNDRAMKALKPAPKGKLIDVWDTLLPGFGVRISESGRKTFVLAARYPGSSNPTRRALGIYGVLGLADARTKAQRWLGLIEQGRDPAIEVERERFEQIKRQENSFTAVAKAFIASKLSKERRGEDAERDLRNVFIPVFGKRPITEITDLEIQRIIETKAKTAPVQARNLLALIKRFFRWAKTRRVYGLTVSPCGDLMPRDIFDEDRTVRDRELSDDELIALMRATEGLSYPFGPVYRLLLLTGLRLNEVAHARWSEFDSAVVRALRQRQEGKSIKWAAISPDKLRWIIPKERMKGRNNRARAHAVPLTPDILAILETLPLFENGDYLFSTTAGQKPAWIGDKIKKKLDAKMLAVLQEAAKKHNEDPKKVRLANWRNHDLRRVIRSRLARLKIQDHIAEAVLAHARPGIKAVYDVYDYFDEKRDALTAWSVHLRGLLNPKTNVVRLRG